MSTAGSALLYDADHTFDVPNSVTYGSDIIFDVSCDPDTGTCGMEGVTRDIEITTCRQRDVSVSLQEQTVANDVISLDGSRLSEIPHEINCGIGTHTAQLVDPTDGSVIKEETFEVKSFNMGDPPNKGNYILLAIENSPTEILGYNPTPPSLNHFFLTNDAGDGSNYPKPPDGAYLLMDYFDDNAGPGETELAENYKYGAFEPNYGDVLSKGDGSLAAITAQDQKYTDDGGGNGNWWKGTKLTGDPSNIWDYVVTQNFDDSMDLRFRFNGCKVGRPFTLTGQNYGDCTPIHEKDGSFNPEGEIIVATDMSRDQDNFYSDASNSNIVSKSDTNFYVCRGDYRGTDISSSELVKVQQGSPPDASWEYYRCNMDNEWVQDTCPTGQELVFSGDEADCEFIEDVNIRATYFNVSNVSFNAPSQGYTTGFKINRSELDKYIDVTGTPATVDAECWMGEDNDRPSNPDGSVTFTADDSGSGDLWMLEKVPGRSSAENSTYSCIWGLRNTQADSDENLYDTANNDPINSMDGGRIDVKWDDLQTQAASTSTSKIGRWVWDFYEKPEDGGFDYRSAVNDQYHFMFDNEFPYCEGTSFWSSVGPSDRNFEAGTPQQLRNINCSGGAGAGSSSYPDYADTPDAVINSPTEVEVGNQVEFDGSGSSDSDGTIESYNWEVRDGSGTTVASGTGSNFRFTSDSSGTFTVELNVTDDYGAISTTTKTLDVTNNPVGSEENFEVAYIGAHYSDQSKFEEDANYAWSVFKDSLPADSSKLSKTNVPLDTCNMDCVIRNQDDSGPECWAEIENQNQCVGSGEPLSTDDANKFMVLCDDDSGNCGTDTGVTGVANTPGIGSSTRWRSGRDPDNAMTASHELGHNLGLEHVFTEAMLQTGYEFGDTYDPDTVDPTVGECWFPSGYTEDAGGGMKRIVDWSNGGDPFPNSDDKYEGEDSRDYFITYCDNQNRFGPNAEDYMENGPLSDYQ